MKALQVIESAYRCTVEEQDDPAIWIVHAMKGAGAEIGVLLQGAAVSYAVRGQDASGLQFGERRQKHAPDLERDVSSLAGKGVAVYVVEEDLAERGIAKSELVTGPETLSRDAVPRLFADFDQIWHW